MLRSPAENVSERTGESFTLPPPPSPPSSLRERGPCTGQDQSDDLSDVSESDSGVSDLSSDLSSGLKYKARRGSPAKSKQEGRKYKLSQGTQHRPEHRAEHRAEHRHRVVTRDNFEHNSSKEEHFLSWIKWSILIFLLFFLMLTLLIAYHVKCYNNICAISLEAKIQYYKYSSPI